MTSTTQQAEAVLEGAGVRTRTDLVEVDVQGDDARSWLNGQVTNDVRHTADGQAVYCLAVTVKGKIMADVWMLDRGDGLSVLLPESAAERVLESFESQIIMEDVELERVPGRAVISVQGPEAARAVSAAAPAGRIFEADELGTGGHMLLVDQADVAGVLHTLQTAQPAAVEIAEDGWELARLRRGRPRFAVDFDERHYPQEAGLKDRAVSFNKGCYLGQEVVCTLESRGRLSKQLVAIEADAPPADTQVLDSEGKQVGEVTSGMTDDGQAKWVGLAYLKSTHADGSSALSASGQTIRVRD